MEKQDLYITIPIDTLEALTRGRLTAAVYLSDEHNKLKERFGIDRVVIEANHKAYEVEHDER